VNFYLNDYWNQNGDPRMSKYPLIGGGIVPVLSIISFYLFFVIKLGPALMKNRQPFELRQPMLIYNSLLVLMNVYFFQFIIARLEWGRRFLLFDFPNQNDLSVQAMHEIHVGYFIYLSKFVDLGDTIFFILRKKYSQITVLHVYHHASVPILGYMSLKIAPLAPAVILFVTLNCFIHVVMYLYYALAAFGPKIAPYLWWKRYITQMQLGQFIVVGMYGILTWFLQTGYPKALFLVGLIQPPLFFYLFFDFYMKSYRAKVKAAAAAGRKLD